MFGSSYFAPSFFAPSYFGGVPSAPPPPALLPDIAGEIEPAEAAHDEAPDFDPDFTSIDSP